MKQREGIQSLEIHMGIWDEVQETSQADTGSLRSNSDISQLARMEIGGQACKESHPEPLLDAKIKAKWAYKGQDIDGPVAESSLQ